MESQVTRLDHSGISSRKECFEKLNKKVKDICEDINDDFSNDGNLISVSFICDDDGKISCDTDHSLSRLGKFCNYHNLENHTIDDMCKGKPCKLFLIDLSQVNESNIDKLVNEDYNFVTKEPEPVKVSPEDAVTTEYDDYRKQLVDFYKSVTNQKDESHIDLNNLDKEAMKYTCVMNSCTMDQLKDCLIEFQDKE